MVYVPQIDTSFTNFLIASRLLLERLAKGCDEVPPAWPEKTIWIFRFLGG
jgi:hypothetical protein